MDDPPVLPVEPPPVLPVEVPPVLPAALPPVEPPLAVEPADELPDDVPVDEPLDEPPEDAPVDEPAEELPEEAPVDEPLAEAPPVEAPLEVEPWGDPDDEQARALAAPRRTSVRVRKRSRKCVGIVAASNPNVSLRAMDV